MNPDEMLESLFKARKRARIIKRFNRVIESEVLDSDRYVDRKVGVVIERTVIQSTSEHILVREFDPEANYGDAIELFIDDDEEKGK